MGAGDAGADEAGESEGAEAERRMLEINSVADVAAAILESDTAGVAADEAGDAIAIG